MSTSANQREWSEPTVDLAAATQRLAGNHQLLVDLAQIFVDDVPDLLRMLDESIRSENPQKAAWTARRLKCIAANFDATPTVAVAWQVESAARQGELADAAAIEPELCRQFEAVADILHEHLLDQRKAGDGK